MALPEERLPPVVEATAYFTVSEALTNVAKYANASHATVRLANGDDTLVVEVQDDGVGGAQAGTGSGLSRSRRPRRRGRRLAGRHQPARRGHAGARGAAASGGLSARKDTLGSYARSYGGIETANNRFVIAVTPAQRALVETLAADAGVTLIDRRSTPKTEYDAGCTSRAACDWTIRAGSMIWTPSAGNNNCSVGFTARNSANARYTYTAGHCSSGATLWGTGLQSIGTLSSARNSGPVDAAIIPVTNPWFKFDSGGEIYNEFFPGRTVAVTPPSRTSRAPAASDCSLPNADSRGRYFMPQSGAATSSPDALVGQRAPDPVGHHLGRLDRVVVEVEHAEDDRLAGQPLEHRAVEVRLRGLDRDLVAVDGGELGEERVARRAARG